MNSDQTQQTIEMLRTAYRMEMETVANYLANSVYLDGVRAEEVKRSLSAEVTDELGHARMLSQRIKQLGGRIPGSLQLEYDQQSLQPPEDSTDITSVLQGALEAERAAIDHYRNIIKATQEEDPVTADLATQLLADEEEHRSLFEGFLRN